MFSYANKGFPVNFSRTRWYLCCILQLENEYILDLLLKIKQQIKKERIAALGAWLLTTEGGLDSASLVKCFGQN